MSNIDEKIRAALRAEGADADADAEPQLRELIGDLFRGRLRWLNAFGYLIGVVFFVLSIVSIVRFLQAEDVRSMLMWAVAFTFCMMSVGMLKLWFWMELQKNTILREVKRIELQIARVLGIEFALMGDSGGSYAMHADKTSTFGTTIQTTLSKIAHDATHQLGRRLVARNGLDPDTCAPTLKASPISTEAILTCTQALANLAVAGFPLPPNWDGIDVILDRLKLPKLPEQSEMRAPRPQAPSAPPADEKDPAGADGTEEVEGSTDE
jgi:hypothetical protein